MLQLQSALGFIGLLGLAWVLSEARSTLRWRIIISGCLLQIALAAALLTVPQLKGVFLGLNDALLGLEKATQAGTSFVFGYLGGGPVPFEAKPESSTFVLAFRALPLILVVSALSSLLFYWRILPLIVRGIAAILERAMGVGGAVGLSAAANVFVGMVEAPLVIRPYLARLDRGELFMVMTGGMAGVAGTMMVLYASILGPVVPDAMGHILAASIISAPAALVVAAIMVPPGAVPTPGVLDTGRGADGAMDAVTRGTQEGLSLLLNIIALLVVLVALVTLLNIGLGALPPLGDAPITLQRLFGYAMAPLVWLAGIPGGEAATAGALMGSKTVLNEFIAYIDMAQLGPEQLSQRSRLIMTYAMCGFANFGSAGILIGGMAAMVPERRTEIVSLGMRSIVSGTLATLLTGATVGMLVPV